MFPKLAAVMEDRPEETFLVWRDQPYSYHWLRGAITQWQSDLAARGVCRGQVVSLEADYSPNAVALLLALIDFGCIAAPMVRGNQQNSSFIEIAQANWTIQVDADDRVTVAAASAKSSHPLYEQLRAADHPGLVLFSSGSSGKPKGVVHDAALLVDRYSASRKPMRVLAFLIFDHIGGINTLFFTLFSGSTLVTLQDRSVLTVLTTLERHRVELLPASPTFLKLLLLSDAHQNFRLDSLKRVSYGTEPMPEAVLRRFNQVFPAVTCQQAYGLSEVGILSSRSRDSGSLWVQVGGDGYQTRIVDGVLQIKARTAMLGYLNADSPFTADGWLDTQDVVETDGDFIRVLGRKSEIINVGGEKVYPAEVESVIMELPEVMDVTVYARTALTGSVVCATVRSSGSTDPTSLKKLIDRHCTARLPGYKVPALIKIESSELHSHRFKKIRPAG